MPAKHSVHRLHVDGSACGYDGACGRSEAGHGVRYTTKYAVPKQVRVENLRDNEVCFVKTCWQLSRALCDDFNGCGIAHGGMAGTDLRCDGSHGRNRLARRHVAGAGLNSHHGK